MRASKLETTHSKLEFSVLINPQWINDRCIHCIHIHSNIVASLHEVGVVIHGNLCANKVVATTDAFNEYEKIFRFPFEHFCEKVENTRNDLSRVSDAVKKIH